MAEIDFSQADLIYFNDQIVLETYYNGNKVSHAPKVQFPAVNQVVHALNMDLDGNKFALASSYNTYNLKGYNKSTIKVNGVNVGSSDTTISTALFTTYYARIDNGKLRLTTSVKKITSTVPTTVKAFALDCTLQPA